MKLATIRTTGGTEAVRIEEAAGYAVELHCPDVGALLRTPDWRARAASATGPRHDLARLDYAPVVPRPEKILCVGLNYATHIREMGRELPQYPTLFAKYPDALIGAYDDLVLPDVEDCWDWEAELAVVVGAPVRSATAEQARAAIAGYAVLNDVTARTWQYRSMEWLQGKTFADTTPFGPYLVTVDDAADTSAGRMLGCEINGETVQQAETSDLVFAPEELVAYVSTIVPLAPGDVIATGTPGGVGHAQNPKRYLADGDTLVTRISGLGEARNAVVRKTAP
ncbi:fumarylacetoacetate hydrolase family protein [Streptomyces sp. SID3343]|uniref:fumarylacetoacetate hydrolase family protein n=1 Tax=Streptomyces sp. SID3343 TaxID=2690260 RepID=UPI001370FCC6|nr:fumarylacetoacetate hydrolase family protein [Streptomyces sp. SID3343]MYW05495.1 2-hydroxyhepta-2,4-diene-1,7-dioate isomerase [Streptomyces sp. SID3343]